MAKRTETGVLVSVYQTDNAKTRSGRPQRWRFRATAANGKKLTAGESYTNKEDAVDTVQVLFAGTGHTLRVQDEEDAIL